MHINRAAQLCTTFSNEPSQYWFGAKVYRIGGVVSTASHSIRVKTAPKQICDGSVEKVVKSCAAPLTCITKETKDITKEINLVSKHFTNCCFHCVGSKLRRSTIGASQWKRSIRANDVGAEGAEHWTSIYSYIWRLAVASKKFDWAT